jgi:hypothetical protein
MAHEDLKRRIREAFAGDLAVRPPMTLRSADSVDSYGVGLPYDETRDESTPAYFDHYGWGIAHLDAGSWRHYLPLLATHALSFPAHAKLSVDGLVQSLRPPDRSPPRLGTLSMEQEAVIREFLEVLAFAPGSAWREAAGQALEEWWIEGALYRHRET